MLQGLINSYEQMLMKNTHLILLIGIAIINRLEI